MMLVKYSLYMYKHNNTFAIVLSDCINLEPLQTTCIDDVFTYYRGCYRAQGQSITIFICYLCILSIKPEILILTIILKLFIEDR